MKTDNAIKHNIKAHDFIYDKYERIHSEIFNPIEQRRLYKQLEQSITYIKTSSVRKEALDYGCGSGNLTKHLIDLGLYVISADISEKFLAVIKEKYGHTRMVETLKINGQDLSYIKNNRFDFIATYSVLHHVPDYLRIIGEMIRVTKQGGIIYLDHEVNEPYWKRNKEYVEFLQALPKPQKKLRQFLILSNHVNKIRQIINPRYQPEGDIHVWPDDHIEWNKIENLLAMYGCTIVFKEDYLLYKRHYPENIYQTYKNKCNDMRVLIARKK